MRPALALLLLACAACSRPSEPEAPRHRGDEAYMPAPSAAAAAQPQAPDPLLLAKLEPLAAAANGDGSAYGLVFTAADFLPGYERQREELARPRAPQDAALAGLPEPEMIPFEPGELEKGPLARWRDASGLQLGAALPRDGSSVTEAWTRVRGFRDRSTPGMMFTENGVLAEKWRRIHWQPRSARWSHFTEEQERAILSAQVAGPLAAPDPDAKNSARFQCERLQRAVDAAAGKEGLIEGYRRSMRAAILSSYEGELKLLAGRSLLE